MSKKIFGTKRRSSEDKAKRLEAMNQKFAPEEGFSFSKNVDVKSDTVVLTYNLKGDKKVLKYVENRLYDAISMVSDGAITFEMAQVAEDKYVTILRDGYKYSHIANKFDMNLGKFNFFEMDMVLDNKLQVKIILDKDTLDGIDINTIRTIEYVFLAIEERFDRIKEVVDGIHDILSSDEVLDDMSFDVNFFADPYLFMKSIDADQMYSQYDDEE